MKSTQWRYLTAMLLIGDGVVAFVRPRQDAAIWAVGPVKWKAFMGYLYDHPCLTRAIGADDANPFPVADFEAEVLDRPNLEHRIVRPEEHPLEQVFFQRDLALLPDPESQIDLIQFNRGHCGFP